MDLGIEVILRLFSTEGLTQLFDTVDSLPQNQLADNSLRILKLRKQYIRTIDQVIAFLQNRQPTLAHRICEGGFLPQASRFNLLEEMEWAFGSMGIQDKARHLATLYLEDLSDLIIDVVDPHFGFSRYAERLGRSAASFDELYHTIQQPDSYIDRISLEILEQRIQETHPWLVGFSVPFPGNLYSAFKAAQWIRKHHPDIRVSLGGGYPNTELRSLSDHRVFEFFDFITLDDGEAPLLHLIEHLQGKRPQDQLKRTFLLLDQQVRYIDGSTEKDFSQTQTGTPDYSDLPLDRYLSVIEIANPMHRLWSDGRWNKLTLAHGCYWGKCTFCDISLDYIKRYEPANAKLLCDKIEALIGQTGERGFHFVDEAAPPALMRELALEILRRGLVISWWTNIRFEKSFTYDLCQLLKASGCIAVSGGLEVASDRLLQLIDKGVTVEQVSRVAHHFTEAGIMVHAYLMYGFPTQTVQETVDSLEVVRQLFELGVVQSGFWHQFAMTAHSPVGLQPEAFKVKNLTPDIGAFANNDLVHEDPTGARHELFSEGLKKSLFNYMHGICFELPLQEWFDFRIPKTTIPPNYIQRILSRNTFKELSPNVKVIWLGGETSILKEQVQKKGKTVQQHALVLHNQTEDIVLPCHESLANWLSGTLPLLQPGLQAPLTFSKVADLYQSAMNEALEVFWHSPEGHILRKNGLVAV